MSTTLQMYNRDVYKRVNYETPPTIDVEILPDVRHCRDCGEEVTWVSGAGQYGWGEWQHKNPAATAHSFVSPRDSCRYCHSEEHATYRQHAWHDAVECTRCGGHDGHAIGD